MMKANVSRVFLWQNQYRAK